jgi:hypothetical protein
MTQPRKIILSARAMKKPVITTAIECFLTTFRRGRGAIHHALRWVGRANDKKLTELSEISGEVAQSGENSPVPTGRREKLRD